MRGGKTEIQLRLCLLQYPSEGVTDTVIDYCIQFVRFISMPASASNQRVQNKEGRSLPEFGRIVLDGLFMLLLFQLQTPAKDIINDYITQVSAFHLQTLDFFSKERSRK